MTFLALLFWLVVIAALVILTRTKMPDSAGFMKTLIIGVLIVAAIILTLNAFGALDVLRAPVPRVSQ